MSSLSSIDSLSLFKASATLESLKVWTTSGPDAAQAMRALKGETGRRTKKALCSCSGKVDVRKVLRWLCD
jgi:hypothetical protein